MVTVVLKIETEENRPMKQCLVAADIAGAMLCHKFAKSGYSWLEQVCYLHRDIVREFSTSSS